MHMADALISPTVGLAMTAVSGGLLWYSARKLRENFDPSRVPLMGVMGAFVFAAQMINFTIPATGSSGHIGGGMMLAAVLGKYRAFVALVCVLLIQAFLFADGGILALGCNIFNMGFFPCLLIYPLVFLPLTQKMQSNFRIMTASVLSCVLTLQLGAFSVVLEIFSSGVTELPFKTFAILMQPIHLAIGLVEGFLTGAVLVFLKTSRPAFFEKSPDRFSIKSACAAIAIASLAIGGGLSLAASESPDGLEWSIERVTGNKEIESNQSSTHSATAKIQTSSALMPDYNLPNSESKIDASFAGIAGTITVLLAACGFGMLLRKQNSVAHR